MRKRLLAMALTVCMVLTMLAVPAWAAGEIYQGWCGDNVRWYLDTAAGTLTISGSGEMVDYGFDGAPWLTYKTSITKVVVEPGVTRIGACSFCELPKLTTAELADSVEVIADASFYDCQALKRINYPANLKEIGWKAFWRDEALPNAILPDGLTSLGYGVFEFSGIKTARLPASLKNVANDAFLSCLSLTSVKIEEGVETLGEGTFDNIGITSLTIPASVTTIKDDCFRSCKALKTVNMIGGGETLPESCFAGCTSLQRIKLPDNLETVEGNVFNNCTSLQRIDYPASTVKFSSGIHHNNTSLKTVTFAAKNIECSFTSYQTFGVPSVAVLYSLSDSQIKQFAIKFGHDWQLLGSEPKDTWVPGADAPVDNPNDGPDISVTPQFTDVAPTAWYAVPVQWAVENGVTTGTTTTTFSPNQTCTQAQILTFLYRAVGSPAVSGTNPFSNAGITSGKYYYNAMLWAAQKGIITNFAIGPNDPCTRADVVTYLWRLNEKPAATGGSAFTDVPASASYAQAVAWAVKEGITNGTSATTFSPAATCTRAHIVTFLYRDLA